MKKLKQLKLHNATVMNDSQMKQILGGEDTYYSNLYGKKSTPKIDACKGKKEYDSCSFIDDNGHISYGKCISIYAGPLHCSDTN